MPIHFDMPPGKYFGDPAPRASLSQSIAKIILEKSPRHAWFAHPRLNPSFEPDDQTKFDIGNIAHALMLGRGKELTILDFDDWRSKEARQQREAAAIHGNLGVLRKHFDLADSMVMSSQPSLQESGLFSSTGFSEAVLLWEEQGTWMRQMVDWISPDFLTVADYKTTGLSAAPQNLSRILVTAGWAIQAAMARRGLDILHPETAGRRRYLFVVQENTEPYEYSIAEMTEATMTIGSKMLQTAFVIWRECMRTNEWPGYFDGINHPEFPSWSETQWLDREMTEFANVLSGG